MMEMVRVRVNGSSSVVTIPKPFLRAANLMNGCAAMWELLDDSTLRLSLVRDRRLQPYQPAEQLSTAPAGERK